MKVKIDLRSDTVTLPSISMKSAMQGCVVGDDVLGEDPTLKSLEYQVAQLLGKEDAVFVPSGTMANLIALMTHCQARSSEVIVGDQSHIYHYEQGGSSAIAGIHSKVLKNQSDGTILLEDIKAAVRSVDLHFPRTKLLCLENTHNRTGGRVLSEEYMEKAYQLCKELGISLHIDGARIWNAAVALGKSPADLVRHCDSISVCLSKGLGAPVGSLLVGSKSFIAEARYLRKGLGGGMRQAGILAACGIVAIQEELPRLKEDHMRAKLLGKLEIADAVVDSNMVLLRVPSQLATAAEFVQRLRDEENLWAFAVAKDTVRLVVHRDITQEMVEQAFQRIQKTINFFRNGRK